MRRVFTGRLCLALILLGLIPLAILASKRIGDGPDGQPERKTPAAEVAPEAGNTGSREPPDDAVVEINAPEVPLIGDNPRREPAEPPKNPGESSVANPEMPNPAGGAPLEYRGSRLECSDYGADEYYCALTLELVLTADIEFGKVYPEMGYILGCWHLSTEFARLSGKDTVYTAERAVAVFTVAGTNGNQCHTRVGQGTAESAVFAFHISKAALAGVTHLDLRLAGSTTAEIPDLAIEYSSWL